MIDLPDEVHDAIENIGTAIWMDAFAYGALMGCQLFLPDDCAEKTKEDIVSRAVARESLAGVVRESIRDRVFDYCLE